MILRENKYQGSPLEAIPPHRGRRGDPARLQRSRSLTLSAEGADEVDHALEHTILLERPELDAAPT